ncbi:hypothetical protein B7463_g4216, partial [Scytalidium lignicola]
MSLQQAVEAWTGMTRDLMDEWGQASWCSTPQYLNLDREVYVTASSGDALLIHHVRQVTNDLDHGTHKLSFGTTELPLILRLASAYDYVQEATLGLAATHLALVTKSAEMDKLGYLHRGKAFRYLQRAIGNFSRDNVDAILAASFILSWQAPEPQTYMCLMDGVAAVLKAMQAWNHVSELKAFFDDDPTVPALEHYTTQGPPLDDAQARSDILLDTSICASLDRLRPLVAQQPELSLAVRKLYNFVQNQKIAPPGPTAAAQLKALHPLRTWLLWMPTAFLRISVKDPLVLLVIAHYELVAIAIAPLFPAASTSHFVERRVGVIQRIDREIRKFTLERELQTSQDLMTVPRKWARMAQDRGFTHSTSHRLHQLPFTTSNPPSS